MNWDACREEACELMRCLESEPEHVLHVAALAVSLFDQLHPLHQLGVRERVLLECAGFLHDTGWSVARDGKGHHKESARLIRAHAWKSVAAGDVHLMAMVARYHRKAMPADGHEDFAALDATGKRIVRHLGALIRVADGLDRSHTQRVEKVAAQILPAEVCLRLTSARPLHAEEAAVRKKANLAVEIWSKALVLERA